MSLRGEQVESKLLGDCGGDRRDAKTDPAGPRGNLWLPAVLKRVQISRSGSSCAATKQNLHVLEGKLQGERKGKKNKATSQEEDGRPVLNVTLTQSLGGVNKLLSQL